MTIDRAIDLVKLERDYLAKKNEPESKKLRMEIVEALDIALTAMEKQRPKKVEEKRWIYTQCECGYEFSKHHGDGYYSIPYEQQTEFCPRCGQKLEWNDLEREEE